MKIVVIPDRRTSDCYADGWSDRLRRTGVSVEMVDADNPSLLSIVADADGLMWRHAHIPQDKIKALRILGAVEHGLGKPTYPNLRTCGHFDDKIAQFYLLHVNGFPVVNSCVFWNKRTALDWIESAAYPVVFKLACGAGSTNVLKVDSSGRAQELVEQMFERGVFARSLPGMIDGRRKTMHRRLKALLGRVGPSFAYAFKNRYPPLPKEWWIPEKGYAYFQDFLDGNHFDTRVTIIGNRAFAFRRFNRAGDFRASGGGKIDYDPDAIDCQFVEVAFAVSRKLSFQCMAFDFLYDNQQPAIIEMSYAFLNSAVAQCPGHWDSELRWHEGAMAPEDAQVDDFIASIRAGAEKGGDH